MSLKEDETKLYITQQVPDLTWWADRNKEWNIWHLVADSATSDGSTNHQVSLSTNIWHLLADSATSDNNTNHQVSLMAIIAYGRYDVTCTQD